MDLNATARTYKSLQSQVKKIEEEMKPFREALETAALDAGGVIQLPDFKISLIEATREGFSLSDARKAIPEEVLRPFVKPISYTQLRVSEK